jgi:cellulose synthase/poly-beta-1,6-N-acetylglucosamine synthase-like glycosyltransferase
MTRSTERNIQARHRGFVYDRSQSLDRIPIKCISHKDGKRFTIRILVMSQNFLFVNFQLTLNSPVIKNENIADTAVSVIIPTYNRAQYVTRAIDSVSLRRTGIEIIIVDDSSERHKEYSRERYAGRIRYIYQPNKGPAAARNTVYMSTL